MLIWKLILADPARRLVAPLLCLTFLLSVSAALSHNDFMLGMGKVIFAALFAVSEGHRRAGIYQMSLPIPARTLWAARMAVLLTLFCGPQIIIVAVMLAAGHPLDAAAQGPLRSAAAMALGLMCWQLVQFRRMELSRGWAITAMIATPLLAVAAALTPRLVPGWTYLLVVAFTAVLAWWHAQRLPLNYETAPDPSVAERPEPAASAVPGQRRAWPQRIFWNSVMGWPFWLFVPVLVFQSLMGNWPLSAFYAVIFSTAYWRRVSWVFSLPVGRRTLLAWRVVPALLLVLGSYWLALWVPLARGGLVTQFGRNRLDVPLLLWERSPSGAAPEIRAPWGESLHSPVERILGGWFYNPYAVSAQSSARFRNWQFERATEAVYGPSLPVAETANQDAPWIRMPSGNLLHAALAEQVMLILIVLYLQWIALVPVGFSWGQGWRGGTFVLLMIAPLLPLIFPMPFWSESVTHSGVALTPWAVHLLPANGAVLAGLALSAALLGLWLMFQFFERTDLAQQPVPSGNSLLGM
ncbi:hypothetical protein [Paludibaculum fermentans]|uniref:Uncharacterized protein n=1 Tax=Paludibaculum fermentans TaxID=1473598 RepID=A0A7S7NUH7_PALFE|nr:hypothetical protein [Paludibaculum fermentans]QOY90065.1 hypothetical protein IRI77_08955 [Paludibaculum fermentans]